MMRRTRLLSPVAVVLPVVGGCTSDDGADRPVAGAAATTPPSGLCAKLGGDLLHKLAPKLDVETWPGADRSCSTTGRHLQVGAILDITLHDEANYTDTQCASERTEATRSAVWLSADELAGVGEQACGYTVVGPPNRVDVWVVARRGAAHVKITYSRHEEELTAARTNVMEVAKAALALA